MNIDSLAVTGVVLCLVVAPIGALLVLLVWWFGRLRRAQTPESRQQQAAQADQRLDQRAAGLRPWQAGTIADLSSEMDYTYTRLTSFTANGTIAAVSDGQPLIAFVTSGRLGTLSTNGDSVQARTTAHRWQMTDRDGTIEIMLNDQPFGAWRYADGTLLDATGQPVGLIQRPDTTRVYLNNLPTNWDSRFSPVVLRDRLVGGVIAASGGRALANVVRGQRMPAVQLAIPQIDSETELWLLALVVLEAAFFTLLKQVRVNIR